MLTATAADTLNVLPSWARPLLQLTRHELDHAMANMDEDGSGAVSEIEFGTFWRAYAVKHQYDPSHRTASSPCLCVCV